MTPTTSDTISLDELNKTIAEQKGVSISDSAVGGSVQRRRDCSHKLLNLNCVAEAQAADVARGE